MNTGGMKNIVILKDLPSNLVEEAIVFLKENTKLKKPELIDVETKKNNRKTNTEEEKGNNPRDYIVNEAQMLIADYISKVENSNKNEEFPYKRLKRKYCLLKKISFALAIGLIANMILLFAL